MYQHEDLLLDVLGLPDVQLLKVKGIFLRLLADLVLLNEELLVLVLMVSVVVEVLQG